MIMKKKSEFDTWFVKQFGLRERAKDGTDQDLQKIAHNGAVALEKLRERDDWDNDRRVALKAWCAREFKQPCA
jgi:hypothetical protein